MCYFVCDCVFVVFLFFFFQAEDGIRDLVRSRGLGDVYKRQVLVAVAVERCGLGHQKPILSLRKCSAISLERPSPVSYTHLTLPTSDLV